MSTMPGTFNDGGIDPVDAIMHGMSRMSIMSPFQATRKITPYAGKGGRTGFLEFKRAVETYCDQIQRHNAIQLNGVLDLSEEIRITVAAGFLAGHLSLWYSEVEGRYQTCARFYKALAEEVFGRGVIQEIAVIELPRFFQGQMTVAEYNIEFKNLLEFLYILREGKYLGVDEAILLYEQGLNYLPNTVRRTHFEDSQDALNYLKTLMDDAREYEMVRKRRDQAREVFAQGYGKSQKKTQGRAKQENHTPKLNTKEGNTLTQAERNELRKNGGCFSCRQFGHRSFECPNKQMSGSSK